MAEILGLGVTHFPPLAGRDQDMARILRRALADPGLPPSYRQPAGWPEAMREEWGQDEGRGAAARHREFLVNAVPQGAPDPGRVPAGLRAVTPARGSSR